MPTVSVIVPARNAEATVLHTIRSVQRQTLADFELLVIDDGSDDGTLAKLSTIEDRRLRILTQRTEGVSAARNHGIRHATGEFVAFIDADDLWTPDKLELQVRALRERPEAGAAYSWTAFVDEAGGLLFPKERQSISGRVHANLIESNFLASASNVLARRACIEAAGKFEQRFEPAEDWEFWLRVSAACTFALVPRYQVLYRFRFGSHSGNPARTHQAMCDVLEHALTAGAPELRRGRNIALANIEQYISFLYLARSRVPQARRSSARLLARCLRRHPAGIATRKVRRLMVLLLLSLVIPAGRVPTVAHALLRAYGSSARLVNRDFGRIYANGARPNA
jgi:glycosyltransferase involved in cell wall biosynthesis